MGADVLGQFIEAVLCFGVGAYFGVKIAFTEIIGECSGKALRVILELILGVSYVLCIFAVIFWFSDGNLKYYHFVVEAIGALIMLPLARKFFRKYKRGIQRVWLWLLGKNADVDNQEPIAKIKKNKRIRKKNLLAIDSTILSETDQKSGVISKKRIISVNKKDKADETDKNAQKSILNRVEHGILSFKFSKSDKKRSVSMHTAKRKTRKKNTK